MITVKQADDDADLLIVQEAIHHASVVGSIVVGEDTDLLILLLHYVQERMDLSFLRPSRTCKGGKEIPKRLTNIQDVANKMPELKKVVLALHALSGCDTTSGFFKKGKKLFLKFFEKNNYFLDECSIFYEKDCIEDVLFDSGEKILRSIYGNSSIGSINDIR